MPSASAKVTVVGAGVAGLTTAICLSERGFAVTVVARDLTASTTSSVPAAMWFPYKVRPVSRTLGWARVSLDRFAELAGDPATGVRFCRGVELLRDPVERPWWAAAVESFERVPADELPAGWKLGFAIDAPVIETPLYLPWLGERARRAGVRVEQRAVTGLAELMTSGASLVVNCSGLGARELVSDPEVFPSRGQLVHVEPKAGLDRYLLDESTDDAITYVVPRSDAIVLGSTLGDGETRLEVDERDTRDILRRATALVPEIAGQRVLGAVVGLRPCRSEVRLERERIDGGTVIHNYGHGGAGFTLSWGCAREVADLATAHGAAG